MQPSISEKRLAGEQQDSEHGPAVNVQPHPEGQLGTGYGSDSEDDLNNEDSSASEASFGLEDLPLVGLQ